MYWGFLFGVGEGLLGLVFIPEGLWGQIVDLMPIASVEAVVLRGDSVLFMRRRNSPAAGLWWFPGGRIRRGELFNLSPFSEETTVMCSQMYPMHNHV